MSGANVQPAHFVVSSSWSNATCTLAAHSLHTRIDDFVRMVEPHSQIDHQKLLSPAQKPSLNQPSDADPTTMNSRSVHPSNSGFQLTLLAVPFVQISFCLPSAICLPRKGESALRLSTLPTNQPSSPHNLGQYTQATPESPLPHACVHGSSIFVVGSLPDTSPHTSYASLAPPSFGDRLASQHSYVLHPTGISPH